MTPSVPCRRCGADVNPAAWCNACIQAGRVDFELIKAALIEDWMVNTTPWCRDVRYLKQIERAARRVHNALITSGRLPGEPTDIFVEQDVLVL